MRVHISMIAGIALAWEVSVSLARAQSADLDTAYKRELAFLEVTVQASNFS